MISSLASPSKCGDMMLFALRKAMLYIGSLFMIFGIVAILLSGPDQVRLLNPSDGLVFYCSYIAGCFALFVTDLVITAANSPQYPKNFRAQSIAYTVAIGSGVFMMIMFAAIIYGLSSRIEEAKNPPEDETSSFVTANACNRDLSQCIPNVLVLQSAFSDKTPDIFEEVLLAKPDTQYVCFDSPGGNAVGAAKMAEIIKNHNLNTCVAEQYYFDDGTRNFADPISKSATHCASACPFVLMAGKEVTMVGDVPFVGFHAASRLQWYMGLRARNAADKGLERFREHANQAVDFDYLESLAEDTHFADLHLLEEEHWPKLFTHQL
ncbi:hypothetical protein [Vibrio mediterranei]|uniref:hypothetical protein n=1 Tax=Vibrio mediterranei TaxID=689 RepID=UPI0040677B39